MKKRPVKYVYSHNLIKQADKNPAVKGRASMTHELIRSYGLLSSMELLPAKVCSPSDLRGFHSADYISELEKCGPEEIENQDQNESDLNDTFLDNAEEEFGLGFDCPTWPGIIDYVCTIGGATMTACKTLCKEVNDNCAPVILNWTGGWHHAQRDKAAGFCYVNDVVLGILLLRKRFQRILYIDLDAHHGDGVENAFEVTRRVFTLSFHKYEHGFYPGSGDVNDCGRFAKGYAANFPYRNGMRGETFKVYFKRVLDLVMTRFEPDVCVLQCGADAMVGDPLGGTQITPTDFCYCVTLVLECNLPTVLLGGGGYNYPNASRLWTQLTAMVCGQTLCEDIPDNNAFFLHYGPDYSLHLNHCSYIKDENSTEFLEKCLKVMEDNLTKYNVKAV